MVFRRTGLDPLQKIVRNSGVKKEDMIFIIPDSTYLLEKPAITGFYKKAV
ncbi:MAG: hypothetical protein STSR0007_03940 [Thermovirga sp.]